MAFQLAVVVLVWSLVVGSVAGLEILYEATEVKFKVSSDDLG